MKGELLFSVTEKDFTVQTLKGSGPGGQNRNKRETAVRIIHVASGAVVEASDSRDQLTNKRNAIRRLAESPRFKLWVNLRVRELNTKMTLEQEVEKTLVPENLKIEGVDENGKWVELVP